MRLPIRQPCSLSSTCAPPSVNTPGKVQPAIGKRAVGRAGRKDQRIERDRGGDICPGSYAGVRSSMPQASVCGR